jgi:hypothetical protein
MRMKNIGKLGVTVGILYGLSVLLIPIHGYFRGLHNLRKFGGEYYKWAVFENMLREMWPVLAVLLILSLVNIFLGIGIIRNNKNSIHVWIIFHSIIIVASIVLFIFYVLGC